MYDNYYLQRLFESVMMSMKNSTNSILLIRHYNALELCGPDIKKNIPLDKNIAVFYYDFCADKMRLPYEPFFGWIKNIYESEFERCYTIDTFLDQCGIYQLQREVFKCILNGSKCMRNEDVLMSEIDYEQKRFKESLKNIVKFIASKKQVFFIFRNFQSAGYSTIEIVKEFIKKDDTNGMAFMLICNDAYSIDGHLLSLWRELLETAEEKNYVFDWDMISNKKSNEKPKMFIPARDKCDEYIDCLENMYFTLAIDQAAYYLEMFNQRIEKENWGISNVQRMRIHAIYALVCVCKGDDNTAVLIAGNELNKKISDYRVEYMFNYILGLAQIDLLQVALAQKYALKCFKLARKNKDKYLIFKSEYLDCIAKYYNWKTTFLCDFTIDVKQEFINKLIENNYLNTLAYVYAHAFENEPQYIEKVVNGEAKLEYLDKSIRIGESLDNITFLLRAYMKNIILYSSSGYNNYANELYRKRIELVRKEKTKIREGHMYNGLGYNCLVVEQYVQANNYFNNALKIMYEENNAEKLTETLYNMSINCFVAGDYYNCYENMIILLRMLRKMGSKSVQMCNASKLYGIIALVCHYLEKDYECIMYINNMKVYLRHIIEAKDNPDYTNWDEDMCLYYMLMAIVNEDDNILDEAYIYIKKAKTHLENSKGNKFIWYTTLSIEYANICKKMNKIDEANKIIDEAIAFSNKKGYNHKMRTLVSYTQGKNLSSVTYSFPLEIFTAHDLMKVALRESTLRNLKEREKDIGILAKWKDSTNTETKSLKDLINTSMQSIINTFNLDGCLYIRIDKGKTKIMFEDSSLYFCNGDVAPIVNFFSKSPSSFVINRTDKNYDEYDPILQLFGINNIVSLIGIPISNNGKLKNVFLGYVNMHRNFTANKVFMSEENLIMIKFAFGQAVGSYQKHIQRDKLQKMNEKLKDMSYKDTLTGLYNRQGLRYVIEKKKISNNRDKQSTVLYMDLDNFKYYNDTYGHLAGDYILVCFSDILRECVMDRGHSIRYGGDEFVVVITNSDIEETRVLVENIYQKCRKELISRVSKMFGTNISAMNGESIGCSVGVASFDNYDNEDELYEAIRKADEALYYTKKNNKGNMTLWNKK